MRDKIKTIKELKPILEKLKNEGKKIATTNGSFDLLHLGHVYILEGAKRLTDVLIVLLNSDSSIRRLRGPQRPIVSENERAEMLSALECVDYIIIFNEDKPLSLIKEIKPDLHIKGGTFVPEKIKEEKKLIESWNGKHITLPLVTGFSTTNLIEKVLEKYNHNNLV